MNDVPTKGRKIGCGERGSSWRKKLSNCRSAPGLRIPHGAAAAGVIVTAAACSATTRTTTSAARWGERITDATAYATTTLRRRRLRRAIAVGDVERGHLANLREQWQHGDSHIASVGGDHARASEIGT